MKTRVSGRSACFEWLYINFFWELIWEARRWHDKIMLNGIWAGQTSRFVRILLYFKEKFSETFLLLRFDDEIKNLTQLTHDDKTFSLIWHSKQYLNDSNDWKMLAIWSVLLSSRFARIFFRLNLPRTKTCEGSSKVNGKQFRLSRR